MEGGFVCSGFTFYNDFDSANLAKVVFVPPNESVIAVTSANTLKGTPEIPDAEFNLWTKPDCCGTEFENGNRTWFYFGIKAPSPCLLIRLNIVDLNRQGRMYSQGMAPVFKVVPGKMQWERIRDKPIYNTVDDIFTLSFKYKTPENVQSITYFAFTYPYSYTDLEKMLLNIHLRFENYIATYEDDIYYTKETLCRSLEGRDVHLLTISSYHGITAEMEIRLKDLFPEKDIKRPFKFIGKKVVLISARVHPGETPSTFVFNGLLNLLLTRDDPVAIMLRRLYVFKMIPFLNPDGVSLGHYRTDTRGVNLNRVYLSPSLALHPPVYAARALIRYYHFDGEKQEEEEHENMQIKSDKGDSAISMKVSHMTLDENKGSNHLWCIKCKSVMLTLGDGLYGLEMTNEESNFFYPGHLCKRCKEIEKGDEKIDVNLNDSRLFLYIDLHGHASKKGIFMYGNHFDDLDSNVECMLLPKLMSINNHNFHFTACNFTERNMYLRDRRDGMSREGSGRVAVLKLTGLTKSYTLECNYNTGRIINVLPPTIKEPHGKIHTISVPPKYNPQIFEEVGKSLGASILDLTGQNPCTRLPNSEFHSLTGLRDWLRINCAKEMDEGRIVPKFKLRNLTGLHNQGKMAKTRPISKKLLNRPRPSTVPIERKENMAVASAQPSCSNVEARAKSAFRLNKTLLKAKSKKDFSHHKLKRNTNTIDKQKSLKTKSQKVRVEKKQHSADNAERKKLKEICFARSNDGKSKENEDGPPMQIFASKKSEVVVDIKPDKSGSEAGPSKPTFIVHSFARNTTFLKAKFKKHSLRRLTKAPTTDGIKVDKVKKRKKRK